MENICASVSMIRLPFSHWRAIDGDMQRKAKQHQEGGNSLDDALRLFAHHSKHKEFSQVFLSLLRSILQCARPTFLNLQPCKNEHHPLSACFLLPCHMQVSFLCFFRIVFHGRLFLCILCTCLGVRRPFVSACKTHPAEASYRT
mgnify:FL=1